MITRPRCFVLSAIHVDKIHIMKDKKYGGAARPCASIDVKCIPVRIVGRKTGSDEKLTLHEKYISYSVVRNVGFKSD